MDVELEDLKVRLEEQLWWLRTLCSTAEQHSQILAQMRATVGTTMTSEDDAYELKHHAHVIGAVNEAVALVKQYTPSVTAVAAPAATAPHCCEALREALAFLGTSTDYEHCAQHLPTFWLVLELTSLTPLQDVFCSGFEYVKSYWEHCYTDDVAITQGVVTSIEDVADSKLQVACWNDASTQTYVISKHN